MKIQAKLLRDALAACAPATKAREATPMSHCVRLKSEEGGLIIQASTLDVWIERFIDAKSETLDCVVPLKTIVMALELDRAPELTITPEKGGLRIKGDSNGRIAVMEPSGFPVWPEDAVTPYGIACDALADGIESVAWAAMGASAREVDTSRPNLQNIAVILSAKKLECVSTDGRMIAYFMRPEISCDGGFQLPQAFAAPLVSALREKDAELSVGTNAAVVKHKLGRARVKLSDLTLPDAWRGMMASKDELPWLEMESAVLGYACQAAQAYNTEKSGPRLQIDWNPDGNVRIYVDGDTGNKFERVVNIPDAAAGEAYAAMNSHYLNGALQRMGGPTVKFAPDEGKSFWSRGDLTCLICQLGATPTERIVKEMQKK